MKPICIFFHCLFQLRGKRLYQALPIIGEQMGSVKDSGLLDAASYFCVGINGTPENSAELANAFIPKRNGLDTKLIFHGDEFFSENGTILAMAEWAKLNPGWAVLYFHSKGASRPIPDSHTVSWRQCMMRHLITNWKQCVADLDSHESVGCHWMTGDKTPPGQSIWAGNFYWATSDFLATLPSIMDTARVKESGICAEISRHESEVWIGNGPRLPTLKDYCPDWNPGKPHS